MKISKIISKLWNCKVMKFHDWTCDASKGIGPTKEQVESGVEGFKSYATMYCDRCGVESELNKRL